MDRQIAKTLHKNDLEPTDVVAHHALAISDQLELAATFLAL